MKTNRILCLLAAMLLCAAFIGCAAATTPLSPAEAQKAGGQPAAAEAPAEPEAVSEPELTPEPAPEPQMLPWNGHTLSMATVQDDGTITMGNYTVEGRLIKLTLDCVDGVISWEEVSGGYTDFVLRDAAGNDYAAIGAGMKIVGGEGVDISALESAEFAAMQPIFDIPAEMPLDELTLRVSTDTEGETITVPLAGVPLLLAEDE